MSRNAAGSGLTSSVLTLQPLAPPQRTEIFIQSLKQCQLHSNCLSSDLSLSHPPYHPCSSFPCLLHSSVSSTPALHLPKTTQNRANFPVAPAQASAGKHFSFQRTFSLAPLLFPKPPPVQSLESAVRILHGPHLFQPPTWLCQHVHDSSVNQDFRRALCLLSVLLKCSL